MISTNQVEADTWDFVILRDDAKWDISWNIMLSLFKLNLGVSDYPQFSSYPENVISTLLKYKRMPRRTWMLNGWFSVAMRKWEKIDVHVVNATLHFFAFRKCQIWIWI